MPSASYTKVNAVSHRARVGVSMTSDLMWKIKYLQTCVSLWKVKSAMQKKFVVCSFLPSSRSASARRSTVRASFVRRSGMASRK